jgi:hypothetical protein
MWSAMDDWGGMFNPLNMTIVQPEQYFDFTIDEPWARYAYTLPDGRRLEGQLALKGTVDLIAEENPETLHYTDWKTGMRKDWATGKPKDWKKLRDDPQLRLYHYALSRLIRTASTSSSPSSSSRTAARSPSTSAPRTCRRRRR